MSVYSIWDSRFPAGTAEDGIRESKKGFLATLARSCTSWFQAASRIRVLKKLGGSKRRGGIVCLVK